MRINIENCANNADKKLMKLALEELVRCTKELRDRTRAGDMTALDDFFDLFKFNDSQSADAAHESAKKVVRDGR